VLNNDVINTSGDGFGVNNRITQADVGIQFSGGDHKPRPLRPKWHLMQSRDLERLAEAGVGPEQVDVVLCTHLHMDHVGWFTRRDGERWVPTFPDARHVFSRADYEHYLAPVGDPEKGSVNQGSFGDSVISVVEAGRAEMVAGAHTVDEHLSLELFPGHAPGTVAVRLASRGAGA